MNQAPGPEPDEEGQVRRHAPLVYGLLGRVPHPPELRDDLLQEGFLGLVEALRGFDRARGTRFSTYAIPRIWGRMRHLLRSGARRFQHEETRDSEFWAAVADPLDRFASEVSLEAALRGLEPDQAALLRRRLFEGLDERRLAEALGVSQSTVSRRLKRALMNLHQQLTGPSAQSNPGRDRH